MLEESVISTLNSEREVTPIVSIGIPVYNGEKHIREALDSLLAQTFGDFELIISDNHSTDNTEMICREYAARDKRIRYIRQKENKGAHANFVFVLQESRGEYFSWAAYDDVRSKDFLEVNLSFLKKNPDYVASVSPVRFAMDEPDSIKMGDASLERNSAENRVVDFFGYWHANGRFYSLFRREVIIESDALLNGEYLGGDWAFILDLARKGKLKRLKYGEVILGKNGVSNSTNIFRIYRKSLLDWLFPFRRLTCFLYTISKGYSNNAKLVLAKNMLVLNLLAMRKQIKYDFVAILRITK